MIVEDPAALALLVGAADALLEDAIAEWEEVKWSRKLKRAFPVFRGTRSPGRTWTRWA